jgi:hypothetical protein
MRYLDEIRAKRTRQEPLTPIEQLIFDHYWINPRHHEELAISSAEQFLRMVKKIGALEMDAALNTESEKK